MSSTASSAKSTPTAKLPPTRLSIFSAASPRCPPSQSRNGVDAASARIETTVITVPRSTPSRAVSACTAAVWLQRSKKLTARYTP